MDERHYRLFIFCVFLVAGLLGTFYYVAHEVEFVQPRFSTTEILRSRQLVHRLRRTEFTNANLASQIVELNFRLASVYENNAASELARVGRFSGISRQEGPGVEIILQDNSKPLLLGENPNIGIIHHTDLLQVVNELRAAGAIAVAINDRPVTALTGISCSGPIILVNSSRIASPFVIHAIGDPERIMTYLEQSESMIKELQKYGISVSISQKTVVVPAYAQETI